MLEEQQVQEEVVEEPEVRSYCLVSVLVSGRKLRYIEMSEVRLRYCTGQSWTSAGRTCLENCGAAGADQTSQRRASPRDASCRTGH